MKIKIENLEDLKLTGVYCIENIINNKKYIGSTKDSFKRRYTAHRRKLRSNKHFNCYLQAAWNKDKEENFIFSILEISNVQIRELELKYINKHNCFDDNFGYNFADPIKGATHSKEIREKIAKTLKEKHASGELEVKSKFKKGHKTWNKGKICKNISKGRRKSAPKVEIYDINKKLLMVFDNMIELIEYSKTDHNLPLILTINSKDKVLRPDKIYLSIRENRSYKGLYFKTIKK